MRRRRTPTGWFKRNPRHYRFAMPNVVWEYGLKPVEFMIFSYLCYYSSTGVPDLRTLATGVHTTATTVKKYLGSLTAKGYINKIGIPVLKCESARFFTLPNEIFLLQLPPSAFIVYTYLLLSKDRQSHACHRMHSINGNYTSWNWCRTQTYSPAASGIRPPLPWISPVCLGFRSAAPDPSQRCKPLCDH